MNKVDNVNHPKHYEREGAMECIDEMVLVFGEEAVKNFCLCNIWKYRYRAADKNKQEDILKSDWYLRKYKELSEKTNSTPINYHPYDYTPYMPNYEITPCSQKEWKIGDWPPSPPATCNGQ